MMHHVDLILLSAQTLFYGENSGIDKSFGKSGQPPTELPAHHADSGGREEATIVVSTVWNR